jgi:hypothetical protein
MGLNRELATLHFLGLGVLRSRFECINELFVRVANLTLSVIAKFFVSGSHTNLIPVQLCVQVLMHSLHLKLAQCLTSSYTNRYPTL